jgi:hypothetical protein
VNADVTFTYAEDGVTVACFDPLLIEHPWLGANPESIRERAHGLRFGVERARSDSLALVERLTGVRLDRARLEKPHRCVDAPGDLVATMPSVQEYSGSEARLSGSGGVDSTRRQVALVGVVLPEQAKRSAVAAPITPIPEIGCMHAGGLRPNPTPFCGSSQVSVALHGRSRRQ